MANTKYGLKRGLVLLSLVAVILPAFVVSVFFAFEHNRTTLSDINADNMRLAEAIRNDVTKFLQPPLHTAGVVAQLSLNPDITPHLNVLMSQLVRNSGFFERLILLDKTGSVRNIGTLTSAGPGRANVPGFDLFRAEFIERARRLGTHTWSESVVISPATGDPTLYLALPTAGGMLVGTVSLATLGRDVAAASGKNHVRIYLVDAQGRIIAHPDRTLVSRQENYRTRSVVSAGLAGHEGSYEYQADGVELVGSVVTIPETGWLVVVEREKTEVRAHLRTVEWLLAVALIMLLLLVLLFIVHIHARVVRPVIAISSASQKLADGQYFVLPAYTGCYRELDELTSNFNSMSAALQQREEDLQDTNLELEHEIEERAQIEASLQEKNEELTAIEEELRTQLDETLITQKELLASQMLVSAMLDNSFQFQGLLTPAGKLIEVNKAALDFVGVTKEAVVGCDFWETPWWSHDPSLQARIRRAVKQAAAGESVRLEVTHQGVDNSLHIIDFSLKPALNLEGEVVYLIPEGQDITDRRLLEQQVIQQQKLEGVGLLAGGIAHDFNNLLTPIFGYAEMIRKKFNPDEQIHARASAILEAATKAKDLIKQLLSFSRKQILSTRLCDLNEIIESFIMIMHRTIRENITIDVRLCAENCPVLVDRTQIEQILLNLTVNAQDAIAGNGRIIIETGHLILDDEYCHRHPGSRPGRYIMLAFSDTGSGMDNATLGQIFVPFFTTKPVGHGTGLGLSTVYGIVKQHEGYIDSQSKPGQGTAFRIYLPERTGAGEKESAAETAPEQREKVVGTILLVEDNIMVMEMTRDLLEMHGHRVLCADEPEAAIELARANAAGIDLLVSDVVMPQMNGPELYGRLSGIIPGLKVLFMSGYANTMSVHDGFLEEDVNFVAKPFTSEVLMQKISELLTRNGE